MVAIFVALVAWYVVSIIVQSKPAFSTLGFSWIVQKVWAPNQGKYGLLPFILGTIETTAIALVLAVPIGLGTAIALAHLVPDRIRPPLSTAVELLAAVPSVVYGLWGLVVLAPLFREHVEPFLTSVFGWTGLFDGPNNGVGLLLAGVILFIMVLPTMVAISRDVLAVVPKEQIEGAMAFGATRWQVLRKVVLPGARTGILGGFTLAMGRALGETVAVALVIGNSPFIAHSIKSNAATLASLIVNNFGEATWHRAQRPVRRRPGAAAHRRRRQRPGPGAGPRHGPRRWGLLGGGGLMTTLSFDASTDPILVRRERIQSVASASLGRRKIYSKIAVGICWAFLVVAIIPLVAVVLYVVIKGLPAWSTDFFTHPTYPEGIPGGGVWNAIVGTAEIDSSPPPSPCPSACCAACSWPNPTARWPAPSASPPT